MRCYALDPALSADTDSCSSILAMFFLQGSRQYELTLSPYRPLQTNEILWIGSLLSSIRIHRESVAVLFTVINLSCERAGSLEHSRCPLRRREWVGDILAPDYAE
jgi:hypothetical protein